jgi:competence protein ComEC
MRCTILAFTVGAAALQMQPVLPPSPGWSLLLVLATGAGACRLRGRRSLAAGMAIGLLTGYFWAALTASMALKPELSKSDEGRDAVVVGTVDSLPARGAQGERFYFAVEQVLAPAAMAVPPRIALSWYSAMAAAKVQPGERWRLKVRLQRPHGNANPHGFDYELWLLGQGIRATGYVRAEGANRRLDSFVITPHNLVERGRAALRDRIMAALAGREYAGVIVALVVGDQRAIDQSDWQVFNRTGISHLVSIRCL